MFRQCLPGARWLSPCKKQAHRKSACTSLSLPFVPTPLTRTVKIQNRNRPIRSASFSSRVITAPPWQTFENLRRMEAEYSASPNQQDALRRDISLQKPCAASSSATRMPAPEAAQLSRMNQHHRHNRQMHGNDGANIRVRNHSTSSGERQKVYGINRSEARLETSVYDAVHGGKRKSSGSQSLPLNHTLRRFQVRRWSVCATADDAGLRIPEIARSSPRNTSRQPRLHQAI